MNSVTFIVRWLDKDGKKHSKPYSDELTARKAKQWLIRNGASGVDIAIHKITKQKEV